MSETQIKNLVDELCRKEVSYKSYDGSTSKTNLIWQGNETILEQIIRKHLLDNRDEKQGVLEAKVFMYEQIISKSTFAPMLEQKPLEEKIKQETEDD